MRPSLLTPKQWEIVRQLDIAGTPAECILVEFPGLTQGALNMARSRGKWPSPTRIMHESAKAIKAAENLVSPNVSAKLSLLKTPLTNSDNNENPKSALEIRMDAAKNTVKASLAGAVFRAAPQFDATPIPAITDIKDWALMSRTLKQMAGLDAKSGGTQVNVQVNAGPWTRPASEAAWIEEGE